MNTKPVGNEGDVIELQRVPIGTRRNSINVTLIPYCGGKRRIDRILTRFSDGLRECDPSTVMRSPGFRVVLVHPCRDSTVAEPISPVQLETLPSLSAASKMIRTCGS